MRTTLQNYLFTKRILVGKKDAKDSFEVIFALAKKFGIKITEGHNLAHKDLIEVAAYNIGVYVPAPFYQNFPMSVKELTKEEYLLDQLIAYFRTYGMDDFSNAVHSVFEKDFERVAYDGEIEIKEFRIVTEEEAVKLLMEYVDNMLLGTRPLNGELYETVLDCIYEYGYQVKKCNSKDTLARLLLETRCKSVISALELPDVLRIVDRLVEQEYTRGDLKNLNLKNRDRKFISKLIDLTVEKGRYSFKECCEKKSIWCGLLHHIHYEPKSELGKEFCDLIRGKRNKSVYSSFEKKMAEKDIQGAVDCLIKGKGASALLRNINYIISRCDSDEEIKSVVAKIDSGNAIVLLQLLLQYEDYNGKGARTFKFPKFSVMKSHTETEEEIKSRKSSLSAQTVKLLKKAIKEQLKETLKGRVGSVYIDEAMKKIAVPINESTSNGGYGVLAKGSRLSIEEGDIIRAFTYWEKVDDIDLSLIGIRDDGTEVEFSWRTMYAKDPKSGVCFSGDETAGYFGGSEFFDIDINILKEKYPDIEYLVCCDNVYSNSTFDLIQCKAGYMTRSNSDTGEVFEPKTVSSSFKVTTPSTYAYLFGIDIKKREFVWLNIGKDSTSRISFDARTNDMLKGYFNITDKINMYTLFKMLGSKVVKSPENADVIVSDNAEYEEMGKEIVHSYDFEKIAAILSKK